MDDLHKFRQRQTRRREHAIVVQNTAKHLKNKALRLITSDEYKPCKKAVLKTFEVQRTPKRTGKRGRPKEVRYKSGKDLIYATVHKT